MASDMLDVPDLPAELEGALSDLGRFRAEYRSGWALLLYMLLGLVLLVLGAGVTVFLLVVIFEEDFNGGFVHAFIFSAAMIVGGGFMCVRSVRAWGARVLIFDRCIVYVKRGHLRVFGWDEITSFQQKSPTGFWEKLVHSSYSMTLIRKDGERLTIDAYVNKAKDLGSRVELELSQRQAADEAS
jgi:hypothetical protein